MNQQPEPFPEKHSRDSSSPKLSEKNRLNAVLTNKIKVVPTTPYSVFVHSSPVYGSSVYPNKRDNKNLAGLQGRHSRRLPFRPDPYPYANHRWSRLLIESKVKTENTE